MPVNSSINISPGQFDRLIRYARRQYNADLFLASRSYPDSGKSYICIEPRDEIIVGAKTSREDLAAFCFRDDSPSFGFFGYHYGQILRGVPTDKRTDFPLGHIKKYAAILIYDNERLELINDSEESILDLDNIVMAVSGDREDEPVTPLTMPETAIEQSLSRDNYLNNTERAIGYIRDGYIYQLNLTIKYNAFVSGLDVDQMFFHFWDKYPASHYVLCNCGPYRIVSTSPERFLQVTDGTVLSQPIKGTLEFEEWNESLIKKVTESPKESAELSMIVDMVRNDISANCEVGSVQVENHKSTFIVDNLIQMYSHVKGILEPGKTVIDLLVDAFPGASITGCPKKKAMELIDELEPHSRDVYCGSFFVINDTKTMESSIAIRTGYFDTISGELSFFAGSGIVVESIPEKEYRETTAKARKFFEYIHGQSAKED